MLLLCGILSLSECKSISASDSTARPPYKEYAKMARYLVHKSNWTSMGTISTSSDIKGLPFVHVVSVADSAYNAPSTGHIYFYLPKLSSTQKDLEANNHVTVSFSEDQDLACTSNNVDTMEPTCARVMITGKAVHLTPDTDEYKQADEWYTDRHPAAKEWKSAHSYYYSKLDIERIAVLDYYGGQNYVSVEDYYKANYDA